MWGNDGTCADITPKLTNPYGVNMGRQIFDKISSGCSQEYNIRKAEHFFFSISNRSFLSSPFVVMYSNIPSRKEYLVNEA